MSRYIYQKQGWPSFNWDDEHLIVSLGRVRHLQGKLIGSMSTLRFDLKNDANLDMMTLDILKTTEIEGEKLEKNQVRSSLARKLGMEISDSVPSNRDVDGIVEMMLDAVQNHQEPLTKERLSGWHSLLFPGGRSGMYKILAGTYRDDATGPMQVVSGAMGRERVHFQAPSSEILNEEMQLFFDWINQDSGLDPVLKAGIAHFWFLTIHPFDDGNGRMARAITDLLLTRTDGIFQRYYSMSAQIQKKRKGYYHILETSQKGTLDITNWLSWFIECLGEALSESTIILSTVLFKQKFWNKHKSTIFSSRQILMLNKILDGFEGKVTSGKWAKITKCSRDTALRDIQDLIRKEVLQKEAGGGRSVGYGLVE